MKFWLFIVVVVLQTFQSQTFYLYFKDAQTKKQKG